MFKPVPGKRGQKGLPKALPEERVRGDVQLTTLLSM